MEIRRINLVSLDWPFLFFRLSEECRSAEGRSCVEGLTTPNETSRLYPGFQCHYRIIFQKIRDPPLTHGSQLIGHDLMWPTIYYNYGLTGIHPTHIGRQGSQTPFK